MVLQLFCPQRASAIAMKLSMTSEPMASIGLLRLMVRRKRGTCASIQVRWTRTATIVASGDPCVSSNDLCPFCADLSIKICICANFFVPSTSFPRGAPSKVRSRPAGYVQTFGIFAKPAGFPAERVYRPFLCKHKCPILSFIR